MSWQLFMEFTKASHISHNRASCQCAKGQWHKKFLAGTTCRFYVHTVCFTAVTLKSLLLKWFPSTLKTRHRNRTCTFFDKPHPLPIDQKEPHHRSNSHSEQESNRRSQQVGSCFGSWEKTRSTHPTPPCTVALRALQQKPLQMREKKGILQENRTELPYPELDKHLQARHLSSWYAEPHVV